MIDTIVLRIHRLNDKYTSFAKHLNEYAQKDKTNIKYQSKNPLFKTDLKTLVHYGDTDQNRFLSVRSGVHVASSSYDITFSANKERDFIEINFSIPKYLYGTNVFQFTDHRHIDIHHTWSKFDRFLWKFLQDFFPKAPDYEDIEINRIDFCLNQIFDSKEDALKYLEKQKDINIMNARSDKNRFNEYGSTTLQAITQNYTFKIYHKGTEFYKNDFNKLVRNNPMKYDLQKLRDIADRTLRYELTFRNGGLNYVFKQSVKDDINTFFNHNLERLHQTRTKAARQFIENDIQNKNMSFRLRTPWDSAQSTPRELIECKTLTFNYELFYAMHDFFMKRVNNYQMEKKISISEMYDKLKESKEKNVAIKGKGDNINQLVLAATLSQFMNIDDLKKFMHKATFYRMKAKLKEAEIAIKSIENISPPLLDFSTYMYELGHYHKQFN